jgi:hypothetical protein
MAVNNNVNQNSQEQIIQEQIRQQQVQQNQTVNNPTNNVEPVGANTEVSNPQPAVPSNETAQVQQMLADGDATRTTLNNQVDQIAIVLPPTDPVIDIPITPGTDIVDTLPANLPGLASTLKNENSIPYADQSFYEGLYDKARGLKDTYDSIPQAANAFYASLTSTEAVQNGQASQFFRYGSASSIGETIASHNNDLGYAKEVFEKIGSKGMAGILSDNSVSEIYDLKNNGNTSTPTKEFYGGLIDGLRKSGNFNAGDMYNLAKAALDINTAKRDEPDANGNTQRGEYMNETREDANKVGIYGSDYYSNASISKLDEFFNSESRPELKAMWEKGLGAAMDDIATPKNQVIAGTLQPRGDVSNLVNQLNKMSPGEGGIALRNYITKYPKSSAETMSWANHGEQRGVLAKYLNRAFSDSSLENKGKLALNLLSGATSGDPETSRRLESPLISKVISDIIRETKNSELKGTVGVLGSALNEDYKNNPKLGREGLPLLMGINTVADDPNQLNYLFNDKDFRKDRNFQRLMKVGEPFENTMNEALSTAANNGFGQDIFYGLAQNDISNERTAVGMVNYFNKMGSSLANSLTANNAVKLGKFFGQTVLSNAEMSNATFSKGGGFNQILTARLNQYNSNPQTAGMFAGYLMGSLAKGAEIIKGGADNVRSLGNYLGDTIGGTLGDFLKSPIDLGPTGAQIGQAFADKVFNSGINGVEDLSKKVLAEFRDSIYLGAQELNNKGRLNDARTLQGDFLTSFNNAYSSIKDR